jgi:aspartyl-tRNA synthetase
MAFPDLEFLLGLMETMVKTVWQTCLGVELETPFPRMTYAEADRRFGTDKPDLRFGLELEDATAATRSSQFGVFAGAETVRFIRVPRTYSRSELGELEEFAKQWGAKGLAYIVSDDSGELRSPIAKFLSQEELTALAPKPGETLLFAADTWPMTSRVLGALRTRLGDELGLADPSEFRWTWITDFPMFEWDEEEQRFGAVHHPFTRPTPEWEERFDEDPGNALAFAYDLIANGNELGGGSFRIHEPGIQARVFDLLGISGEEQRAKFGFLLDALAMGAPPHGGIAFGIDRMLMVLAGEANLRDTIAFPKNQAGIDPMTGAPSDADPRHLKELGIRIDQAQATDGR